MDQNEMMAPVEEEMESLMTAEGQVEAESAEEAAEEAALPGEDTGDTPEAEAAWGLDEAFLAEAEELRRLYPAFDLAAALSDPVMGAFLRGEEKPTLRQLYEMVHMDGILEGRVEEAVRSAVSEAVTLAVRESEERLLGHIRTRGQRPAENGTAAAAGIRMHPAVGRLTRRERAMLARRAEDGEHIRL